MKKIFLLFTLTILLSNMTFSQTCVVGNVTLSTQAEVDAFVIAHTTPNPICDTIDGDLFIGSNTGAISDISDISGFSFLINITGFLQIKRTSLTSLDGLQNITTIGGIINIRSNNSLLNIDVFNNLVFLNNYVTILGNFNLEKIDGFNNLTTMNNFLHIIGNRSLISIRGFNKLYIIKSSLRISFNFSLTNISGFRNLEVVFGNIYINANVVLTECCIIKDFILGIKQVNGNIIISGNDSNCNSTAEIINSCIDNDNDFISNNSDNCINTYNPNQIDTDGDGIGDVCDNCPNTANANQLDTNNNGIGDLCEVSGSGTDAGGVGIGTINPKSQLEISQGDVFIKNIHRGVIMKSSDGKCFRYQPDTNGNLNGKQIICPDN